MVRDSGMVPLPSNVQNAAFALKRWGSINLWTQFVLGIISAVTLFIGIVTYKGAGVALGGFWGICGIITLVISIYFSWRYRNIGRNLARADMPRPSRADTQKFIRLGLVVNLIGLTLAITGTQTVVGNVLFKSLRQTGANVAGGGCFVVPADMISIQANAIIVTAHFVGVLIPIWLLDRVINKHQDSAIKS